MKLKITYEYDTRLELNRVIGFSCVSPANALYKYLFSVEQELDKYQ